MAAEKNRVIEDLPLHFTQERNHDSHPGSPTSRLYEALEAEFEIAEPPIKWPRALRLIFVVGASATLWAVLLLLALG